MLAASRTPAIILVRPQMGENIGAAARAMHNFGLSHLRIVSPRDGWPNEAAEAMAKHAAPILHQATIHETVEAAVADCCYVLATSARLRECNKPCGDAREGLTKLHPHTTSGAHTAILFGAERNGLQNDEISLADQLVTLPTAAENPSLNLGQAVVICCYEWAICNNISAPLRGEGVSFPVTSAEHATKSELHGFFEHLETELEARGFFKTPEIKPSMVQNLRAMFMRAGLSPQEVQSLRGVVSRLTGKR